jgi:hypothetical protein
MLRFLLLVLSLAPAAFVASPLTADDLYGAPDPGWYNQGSGWARDPGDYDAGSYAQDAYGATDDNWYGYDSGYRRRAQPRFEGYEDNDRRPARADYDTWEADRRPARSRPVEPARDRGKPEPISPNGYGAPDWAQEPIRPRQEQRDGGYDAWREPPDYKPGYDTPRDRYTSERSPWRTPPARPRYRFREDPDLDRGASAAGSPYEFRPLTEKERERRQRAAEPETRFADPYRDGRYRPRDNRNHTEDDDGTAFGYEPPVSDDFYRRYYRSGP